MSYVALYRKFRPQTFSGVKGQEHVVRTLKNQIKNNRIAHAYLFTGTRGTGKTSVAKIMAKAINCLDPRDGEPCCECENCRAISAGSFIDVIEMDAASNNGVDDIRNLIEETRYTPAKGKYKVFIIDEAHMITKAAFNAFLKTLEEPPSYTVFILATTEPNKLPQTILSRVQRYDFRRISLSDIRENLKELAAKEGALVQEKALDHIARLGDGSMRDAVSLLDKCLACCLGKELTYEMVLEALGAADTQEFSQLLRALYSGDAAEALRKIDDAADRGKDISVFVTDLCGYLRNVLITGIDPEAAEDITGMSDENMALLKEDAALIESDVIIRYINVLSELINRMRFSSVKQLLAEVCLIKLARPQMETDNEAILDRIRQLEARPAPQASVKSADQGGKTAKADAPEEEGAPDKEDAPAKEEAPFEEQPFAPSDYAGPGIEETFNWTCVIDSIASVPLRAKLKKTRARKEDENIVIYAGSAVLKGSVEKEIENIKAALSANGYKESVVIKEGMPEGGDEGISEEDLLRNINFEITQEEF